MANLVTFAKKLWKDATSGGTPITAAELNRMEGGINDCATQINKLGDSVSHLVFGNSRQLENTVSITFASQGRAVGLVMMDSNGKGGACLYFVSGVGKVAYKVAGSDNEPTWSSDGKTIVFPSADWNSVTVISTNDATLSFA